MYGLNVGMIVAGGQALGVRQCLLELAVSLSNRIVVVWLVDEPDRCIAGWLDDLNMRPGREFQYPAGRTLSTCGNPRNHEHIRFVYGTLRAGEINDLERTASDRGLPAVRRVGAASVPGRLVDFGAWPGLIPWLTGVASQEISIRSSRPIFN